MDEQTRKLLYARYEWISYHLQKEAYKKQIDQTVKNGKRLPLPQFFPCNKGLVFTRAMSNSNGLVTYQVIPDAAVTSCTCHPDMGEKELWDLYNEASKEIKDA